MVRAPRLLERFRMGGEQSESASFHVLLNQRRRIHEISRGTVGGNKPALWAWETKLGGRGLAARVGVATPELLYGPGPVDLIDWDRLPDQFVLEPVWGASSSGVYLLNGEGPAFRDLRKNRLFAAREIPAIVKRKLENQRGSADQMIVEAAVCEIGRPADDWKFYTFQGSIGLIVQIRRGQTGREYKFYDPVRRDLGSVRRSVATNAALPPPENPDELIRAARSVSTEIATPFVRIDLLEHAGTVFFGEATARPGGDQRFEPWLDQRLGAAWEDAAARLIFQGNGFIP